MNAADEVKRSQNPRNNANIFEILTHCWMFDLFITGKNRELTENDLYETLDEHTSSLLGDKLERQWKSEVIHAYKMNRSPSLLRALIQVFGVKYMCFGLVQFTNEIIFKMSLPLLIGELLAYFNNSHSDETDLKYTYMCAFGLLFSIFISTVLQHSNNLAIAHCGMKLRIACSSITYRKALCLSRSALGETTAGKVVNLISNDVSRFDYVLPLIQYIWIGPLQTILVTYFLWRELGAASIIGISTLLLFIPLQGWLAKKVSVLRLKMANKTDERIRLMNEIISGIQVIKMYMWEKHFQKLIDDARKREIRYVRRLSCISGILLSFVITQTRFQMFVSILSYVMLGNNITIRKVFVMAAFYNILLPTMSLFFSLGLTGLSDLLVSITRIQNFLLLKEKNHLLPNISEPADEGNDYKQQIIKDGENNFQTETSSEVINSIIFSNATAKWTADTNALENINLTTRSGRLVAIIGAVGAGKSSLIHAVLRELPLSEGYISVRGEVSYAAQEPWLFGGSVQQNILFGSPMDRQRYNQVVDVCDLNNDFKQFPFGDKTIVGERGMNLSGGQKMRVNLARAVYKQADIYLLDDPLSSVDSRVGKYLFEKCIKEFLKDKTCILITHQMQHLNSVEQIVLMKDGKIITQGSYQEIQSSGFDFAKSLELSEDTTYEYDVDEKVLPKVLVQELGSNANISSPIVGNSNGYPEKQKEEDEIRSSGNISMTVYISYFFSSGSNLRVLAFFFMLIVTQILTTSGDYWISIWVNQEHYVFNHLNTTVSTANFTSTTRGSFNTLTTSKSRQLYVITYTILIFALIIAILIRCVLFVSVSISSSVNLHSKMFNTISKATMHFFNTNSSGRILNRFSKDLGIIDETIPATIMDGMQLGLLLAGIIFVIGFINVYLMIPTFIVTIIFSYIRFIYLRTSRSVKRLEGVARSPIIAHMNASLQGITTIRAHKTEQVLCNEFDKHQDLHSSAWYLFISSSYAFGFWLDMACFTYISVIILSFLVIGQNIHGGFVGLVITQTMRLVGVIQWGIKQTAVLENHMTSVERVLEYINIPREDAFQSPSEKKPPNEWPDSGKIVFRDFYLHYKPDSPYVIQNLNIRIEPMEKIGIVGRTGAGKSSIIAALFRLALNKGYIFIDGIDINGIGLYDLRSKISIIPQEPIIFSETVRKNMDPFDEFSDHDLWETLTEVQLKAVVEGLPDGLNSKMSSNGSNFSVGQKQLLCLARAILRNNKILVLDEASANVDPQTDALIQNTIRNKFRHCTVLTVAHRLNTIMDSDRVLVMDTGRVVEFDHPYNLLKNQTGYLYTMVEHTGPSESKLLHRVASEEYTLKYAFHLVHEGCLNTQCQPNSWLVKSCDQNNMDELARRSCDEGEGEGYVYVYLCCPKING